MAKEFLSNTPQETPIVVSVREEKIYSIDLVDWLNEGETLLVEDLDAALRDRYGEEVATAASVSGVPSGTAASFLVDWTKAARAQEYYLWILFTKSGRKEEGYLRFRTHPV